MYCKKCWHRNVLKAEHCRCCGAPFSEEEREAAYKKTPFGWIDRILQWKAWAMLEPITGNTVVRILVLVGIALYALAVLLVNGSHMRIMQSADYDVQVNTETGVYTLVSEQPAVALRLYIPGKVDSFEVLKLDGAGQTMLESRYAPEDEVILEYEPAVQYLIRTPEEQLLLKLAWG